MRIELATRKKTKIKILLFGVSGSGKTYSALKLGFGLCEKGKKIVVIDTENKSASLYSHLGEYYTLPLAAPYTPENYIRAIEEAEEFGADVIVIDSISHEWEGEGGILDEHEKLASLPKANGFSVWKVLTPRHQKLKEKIIQSPAHVIATSRTKIEYVLNKGENDKNKVEKVGSKLITREGLEYEFTLSFSLNLGNNLAVTDKDRTGLYKGKTPFLISEKTGKEILDWCDSGISPEDVANQEIEKALKYLSLSPEEIQIVENNVKTLEEKRQTLRQMAVLKSKKKDYLPSVYFQKSEESE